MFPADTDRLRSCRRFATTPTQPYRPIVGTPGACHPAPHARCTRLGEGMGGGGQQTTAEHGTARVVPSALCCIAPFRATSRRGARSPATDPGAPRRRRMRNASSDATSNAASWPRAWPGALWALRARRPDRLLLQGTCGVPIVRHPAHGRDGGPSDRSRLPASVGAAAGVGGAQALRYHPQRDADLQGAALRVFPASGGAMPARAHSRFKSRDAHRRGRLPPPLRYMLNAHLDFHCVAGAVFLQRRIRPIMARRA
jgi:hypothetical protein